MKAFNLLFSAVALSIAGTYAICTITAYFFNPALAQGVSIVSGFLLGLSTRQIVENIYGYTLYEALSGKKEDDSKL